MFKQHRLERQVEQGFLRYLSHTEEMGRSDASRVLNTAHQRNLERQVERRLAKYLNFTDRYLNDKHEHEIARDDTVRRVVTIDTMSVIRLDLEERRQRQAARRRALVSHSL
jgi:hypothetical protein